MAGDASFGSVSALLHGRGVDGATVDTDKSINAFPVTFGGNAKITTAKGFLGQSSAYVFDGTGDFLSLANNAALAVETASVFTAELMVRRTVSGVLQGLFSSRPVAAAQGFVVRINANNSIQAFMTGGSSLSSGANAIAANQDLHVAFVRNGGTAFIFVDGVQVATGAFANGTVSAEPFRIGVESANIDSGFTGYLGEIRITKGVARYTANFAPPTAPFHDGAGQVSGLVRDSAGALVARTIRAYRRDTGALAGSGVSDAGTGAYSFYTPTLDEVSVVCLDDAAGTLENDLVRRAIPA